MFKKVLTIIGLLTLVSCSNIPPQRVRVTNFPKSPALSTRADRYLSCVTRLSREGIRQGLLKQLCDASYGSID